MYNMADELVYKRDKRDKRAWSNLSHFNVSSTFSISTTHFQFIPHLSHRL